MTDSDILEALEGQILVSDTVGVDYCNGVPKRFFVNILDLINRQKAEIERLQKEVNLVSIQFQDIQERQEESQSEIDKLNKVYQANQQLINALNKSYFLAKAEAIQEFAERLKDHSRKMQSSDFSEDFRDAAVLVEDIDKLVKEMEGENNA